MKKNYMSWDTYFMSVALISSFRSKDKKSQIGACIADPQKRVVGIGYNGLPRGLDDKNFAYWNDSDDSDIENSKHTYVVHAEKNAIYNSISYDLRGATLYVLLFPCNVCAQAIIQVGIKRVVYLEKKEHSPHLEMGFAVMRMFRDAGVLAESYFDLDLEDKEYISILRETNKFYD